jgi:(4S)-4-hydroxy-5-phosphonooxypentane-2,3-dione isomerase
MSILLVHIRVLRGKEEEFIAATLENRGHSLKEQGIYRFDLLRDEADPLRFVLVEGYADEAAQAAHKGTAHYARWKELVEPMMAEPRTRGLYSELGMDAGVKKKY